MTSFNDHDRKDVPSPTTASPEELEELDRFDCGILTPEERGRFLAKLYADGEKRRSLSEMFELELLRRPEMDELQDAPAGSDDVQTRSAGLTPRWRENPRVLKALLTVSASICVVCVLYALRPVSAPIDLGRRPNVQTATDAPSATAQKKVDKASERLRAAKNAVDVEEEESAPAESVFQALDDSSADEFSALETDADAVMALSEERANDVASPPNGTFDVNKKVVPSQTNGFVEHDGAGGGVMGGGMGGGMGGAMSGGMGGGMGTSAGVDDGSAMFAPPPDFAAKVVNAPSDENRATRGGAAMGGSGGGKYVGGFAGSTGGMGMMGGMAGMASRRNLIGEKGSARGAILSAPSVASLERSEDSESSVASSRRESVVKAPTPDFAAIVAEEERRKAVATPEPSEETTDDGLSGVQDLAANDDSVADVADDADALTRIVEFLYVGKFREARAAWDRLPQSLKGGAAGKTLQGILLFFEGDRDAAEQAFLEALSITPDDPIAARNLDFIRELDGKPAKSEVADP